MTKRGRPSGWQMRNSKLKAPFEVVPPIPTRWERFCYANHIDDPLVALLNGKRKLITEWVQRHHDNAFIPENVLEFLDMNSRWEN